MRHLTLLCCSVIFLSSCRKDSREFTSDFPNGYKTDIIISYSEYWNKTSVIVGFRTPYPYNYYDQQRGLLLPPGCYVKCNGVELAEQPGKFYMLDLEGKQTCIVEIKDHDGTIYTNTLVPPNTPYFTNFPDTISSFENLQLQVNTPDLDSNESDGICIDEHGSDYGGCYYYGTDSLVSFSYEPPVDGGMDHLLYLYRYKYFSNHHLPFAGGSIRYEHVAVYPFYKP